jgi:hypothetical protein
MYERAKIAGAIVRELIDEPTFIREQKSTVISGIIRMNRITKRESEMANGFGYFRRSR